MREVEAQERFTSIMKQKLGLKCHEVLLRSVIFVGVARLSLRSPLHLEDGRHPRPQGHQPLVFPSHKFTRKLTGS